MARNCFRAIRHPRLTEKPQLRQSLPRLQNNVHCGRTEPWENWIAIAHPRLLFFPVDLFLGVPGTRLLWARSFWSCSLIYSKFSSPLSTAIAVMSLTHSIKLDSNTVLCDALEMGCLLPRTESSQFWYHTGATWALDEKSLSTKNNTIQWHFYSIASQVSKLNPKLWLKNQTWVEAALVVETAKILRTAHSDILWWSLWASEN